MGLSKPIKIQQCVKLPDSKYLHINDELAGCFGTEDHGAGRMALVASPFGKKVWPVKVDRDAKGSFLGDGWSQFVAAHGIGVGSYLVIRHKGRGVLTLKVFDASFVIKEFGLTITVLSPAEIKKAFARKPQFIVPLQRSFIKKMPIPPEFLQRGYISEEDLNRPRPIATFLTSWHIELKKNGLNVFFTGSEWPKFLAYFEIAETDVLLIKYQGCMNFSFETFRHGTNEHIEGEISSSQQSRQSPGAQSQEEHVSTPKRNQSNGKAPGAQSQEDEHVSSRTRKQSNGKAPGAQSQEEELVSTRKRKQSNGKEPGAQSQEEEHVSTRQRKQSVVKSMLDSSPTSEHQNNPVCEVGSTGSQACLRKEISNFMLRRYIHLSGRFGFEEHCKITLKSVERNKSWEVQGTHYNEGTGRKSKNWLTTGWKAFCQDNELKAGDICTFTVINSTLWHVVIDRCKKYHGS